MRLRPGALDWIFPRVTRDEKVDPSERVLPAQSDFDGRGTLHWRHLTLSDNHLLIDLLTRVEDHDDPPYRTTAEESAETFTTTASNIGQAMVLGVDDAGVARAYAMVRIRPGTEHDRALCDGGVDPAWRGYGVGTVLLDWQLHVARAIQAATGRHGAWALIHVESPAADAADLLQRYGFTQTRWFTEMRRDLTLPIPDVRPHGNVQVEPWREDLDDAVRKAHNEAFREQWGAEPHTPETWVHGRTYFAPEWSFVALDRTTDRARVAGYLISGRYEGDWEAQGWTEGYTDVLGVRDEWRGMRVATALLAAAMRAYAADGMAYAGLGLDLAVPTPQYGLFSELGYSPTRYSALYAMPL
ncbi:MAG TPA: GNAT family N-acetyltransferase [Actinomycetaceae bacterium]|nr:GNAT family N-acetyltransferase [Actinomycetaceae bacterium]